MTGIMDVSLELKEIKKIIFVKASAATEKTLNQSITATDSGESAANELWDRLIK